MSDFFNDTMQGLLEAIEIEKGNMPVKAKENMPAETFAVPDDDAKLIDALVQIRKENHISQAQLAKLAGSKQQVISRIENKEHSPSLKLFYTLVDALGYELRIVKK